MPDWLASSSPRDPFAFKQSIWGTIWILPPAGHSAETGNTFGFKDTKLSASQTEVIFVLPILETLAVIFIDKLFVPEFCILAIMFFISQPPGENVKVSPTVTLWSADSTILLPLIDETVISSTIASPEI